MKCIRPGMILSFILTILLGQTSWKPATAQTVVIDDFEDGDTSDWIFFGGNNAGGGGGPASDRPQEGAFYLSTGWGGEGSASVFYGGLFRNFPDASQVSVPVDPVFNVWVYVQSESTVDEFTVEITLREDLDGNGWTNGSEDSFRMDTTFPSAAFDDQWKLISAPVSSFADLLTGGNGTFDGDLDEVVVVISGVQGGAGSIVEVDFDYFSLTSGDTGPQFTPVSVCDLKVDMDGDCVVDTPPLGDPVAVEGIVLAWKQFGARGAGAIYDPLGKCCISVFDITDAPDFPEGRMIRVEGWVGNFAGLLEIVDEPGVGTDPIVTDLGTTASVPVMELQAGDLADFSPLAEFMESCLVTVCGVFETDDTEFGFNTNYQFKGQDGQTTTVRIDGDTALVGTPIPDGLVSVRGILGQFNGFTDTCVGYQLLPRQLDDISTTKCKVVNTEPKSFGQIKSEFED